MRKRVINFHLPLLNNTQSQSTQNAIADQLGLLTPQQQQYRRIDEQKKVNDCVMTLEKRIGPHMFSILLKLCGVARESNLNPIWKMVASTKNS